MAKFTPNWVAWYLKATMLPTIDGDGRVESRDGSAQWPQADLRAA
jgi:hypothetical protein